MKRKLRDYQIEFTDEKSREEFDMPYNRIVSAKNKKEALRKLKKQLGSKIKKNKIRFEGIWTLPKRKR